MSPRIRIVSSAYSYIAKRADTANYAQNASIQRPITPPISTNEISGNAITSIKIQDGTILGGDLSQMGALTGQVLKWTGTSWAPANDTFDIDNAWVRGTPDSVLYTVRSLGIARGGANNVLYGTYRHTHVNLGVACTTGRSGYNYEDCTVGGGFRNKASHTGATVSNGYINIANNFYAIVGGGFHNKASGEYSTVSGGIDNVASSHYAAIGGGEYNVASGVSSTTAGGYADTSAGNYSFTTNARSLVPSSYTNSDAFNGMVATASDQLRCGILSKAGGSFTIDHPLDPYNKILNHYFVEGPEMLNIYRVLLSLMLMAEQK